MIQVPNSVSPLRGRLSTNRPAHSNLWDQARDELIAAGVGADELDAAVAEIAPADAAELELPDPDTPAIDGLDRELTAEDFA